jgi:hypothetical protein
MNEAIANAQGEGIYSMYEEVVAELTHLKKRPMSSAQEVAFVILRTVMPLIRDLSHYVRENRLDIDQLMEQAEGSDGTQFTNEDAKNFDLVVQFAKSTLEAAIASLPEGSEEKAKIQLLLDTANKCIEVIETSPIVDGEDEDTESDPVNEEAAVIPQGAAL